MTTTWAYIFHHDGADPTRDRMLLENSGYRSLIVAVDSVADAPELARDLVAKENVLYVEVCGAFSTADALRVSEAVGPDIAVGHTIFSQEALSGLQRFVAAVTPSA